MQWSSFSPRRRSCMCLIKGCMTIKHTHIISFTCLCLIEVQPRSLREDVWTDRVKVGHSGREGADPSKERKQKNVMQDHKRRRTRLQVLWFNIIHPHSSHWLYANDLTAILTSGESFQRIALENWSKAYCDSNILGGAIENTEKSDVLDKRETSRFHSMKIMHCKKKQFWEKYC